MELCRSHHSAVEYAVKKAGKWRLACSACIAGIKPEKVIGLLEADGMYENFTKESSFTQQVEKEMKRSRDFLDQLERKLQGTGSAEQDLHNIRLGFTAEYKEHSKALLDYMNKKDLIDGLEAQYHQQSLLKKEILASLRNATSFLMHQSGVDCGGLSLSKPAPISTQVYNNTAPPRESEPKEAGQITLRAQLARAMSLLAASQDHYIQYYNKSEQLRNQLSVHESGKENSDKRMTELRASNRLLQVEIRNQAETHRKQLDDTRRVEAELRRRLSEFEDMVQSHTQETSLLKKELEVANKERSTTRDAAASLHQDIRKQELTINNLRLSQTQEMDKLEVQYEQSLAKKQRTMQQERESLNNQITAMRKESVARTQELSELANRYAQLSQTCKRLQGELADSLVKYSLQGKALSEMREKYAEEKEVLVDCIEKLGQKVVQLKQREAKQNPEKSQNERKALQTNKALQVQLQEKKMELERQREIISMLQSQLRMYRTIPRPQWLPNNDMSPCETDRTVKIDKPGTALERYITPNPKREGGSFERMYELQRDRLRTEAKLDKPDSAQQKPEIKDPPTAKKQ